MWGPVETLYCQKMRDPNGREIELFQGNYKEHVAVNWASDEDGNLIEFVEVKE